MLITAGHYLWLGAALFCIGLVGLFVYRDHLLYLFMCMEILLLAVNTQFIALGYAFKEVSAQIMVLFILALTAAETATALSIMVLLFRIKQTVAISRINHLKN